MTTPASGFGVDDSPRVSVADIRSLAARELSMPSRLGHALLLTAGVTMAAGIGSLLATEPALPARTRAAFTLIVAIALAWAVFAAWVLARRRVLFGADRVVAARMGLAFSALGSLGMLALGSWGGVGRSAYLGALVNAALCIVAALLLRGAHRRVEALSRRRRELERSLATA